MDFTEVPSDEKFHASAVQFLLDGHEEDAANLLLSCTLQISGTKSSWYRGSEQIAGVDAHLIGPRIAYDVLINDKHMVTKAIRRAIDAVLPAELYVNSIIASAELINIDPSWKVELLEIARGEGVHNQGLDASKTWNNLRFRSVSEIRIAESLDRTGVLFCPIV